MFLRRLGTARARRCTEALHCPDVLELIDGDFAVIGTDITETARGQLPAEASCGPNERIIRVPRRVLVEARPEIPAS